ncbi:nucleotide-binding protein [Burkholderia sp. S-53]|uniref:nucleotide-binding protein n=1 Tax=Burkholderia sp. S-53 TaxID=2906514 RepID=UPI0021D03AFC|nr:nucleotide-binding protein [Burkholderia sp. S-53]UXU90786.1 nucleotide-binding protein [Burkholderia sp. S-53]
MRLKDYYNLIVSAEPGHWDLGEGKTSKGRFHYFTDDIVKARFSPMSDAVEMSLKQYPAIFACETNHQSPTPAYVGHITKVEHRSDGYYLHFERDNRIEPIPQDQLLLMADALDIRRPARGFGCLDSSHWSVKQLDLYRVLQRYGLIRPRSGDTASSWLSGASDGPVDVAAILNTVPSIGHSSSAPAAAVRRPDTDAPQTAAPSRVFLVHGHNVAVREEVARFIITLGLEPVILHEQANEGRTILSKFQDEASRAAFAVILITPDDRGGVAGADPSAYQARARQNVVFEFGFFAGSLGLKHVCALVQGPVEKPSDIDGLVYVSLSGDWKLQLIKEMKAAGILIDLSRL